MTAIRRVFFSNILMIMFLSGPSNVWACGGSSQEADVKIILKSFSDNTLTYTRNGASRKIQDDSGFVAAYTIAQILVFGPDTPGSEVKKRRAALENLDDNVKITGSEGQIAGILKSHLSKMQKAFEATAEIETDEYFKEKFTEESESLKRVIEDPNFLAKKYISAGELRKVSALLDKANRWFSFSAKTAEGDLTGRLPVDELVFSDRQLTNMYSGAVTKCFGGNKEKVHGRIQGNLSAIFTSSSSGDDSNLRPVSK